MSGVTNSVAIPQNHLVIKRNVVCGKREESNSDAIRGRTLGCPSSRLFPAALHVWMRILDEQLDMLFNMPVKSDGEDKSERWRGSWGDLPTEDFGILCVEDLFGGRPQQLAFKPSEDSPSIALLGDKNWRPI